MGRAQGQGRLSREGGQALDPLDTSGRALIDGGFAIGDGLGVARAIGVAAAGALRLRQDGMQPLGQWVHLSGDL